MVTWPEALLAEVAERRCAIVLGAGASASCMSADNLQQPADWPTFLYRGIAKIPAHDDRAEAHQLLTGGRLLDAAEILVEALGPADFAAFLNAELVEPQF